METKSQKKKKIELCQTITNPLGDPYYDFVKDVLIENLLSEIEHEVHWRLLRIPESDEPQIANLIEAKSGKKLGSKHLPFCQCQKCQHNLTGNFNLMKKLRWQNKSPYQGTVFENHTKSLIQHCHTVRNLHILSKNSTLISRENCRFYMGKTSENGEKIWMKNS